MNSGDKTAHGPASIQRRVFLMSAASPLLGGCVPATLTDYTFRLRVAVVIGGKEHVGQSVVRVRWEDHRGMFMNYGSTHRPTDLFGQAVAIHLGPEHDYLFALLHGPEGSEYTGQQYFDPNHTPVVAFSGKDKDYANIEELHALTGRVGETAIVEPKRWPLFVRFDDRSKLETVREVHPDSFSSEYGANSFVKGVAISMVPEKPTVDIVRQLPWADEYRRRLVSPADGIPVSLAHRLGSNHFLAYKSLSAAARERAAERVRLPLRNQP